jgi:hypothetical protein
MITAKMACHSTPSVDTCGNELVSLNAVYAEQGVNKAWAQATPCGSLSLSINNPAAQGKFRAGKEYIITVREAQPGE